MGTFSENLMILIWGAAGFVGGSFIFWYGRRVIRELDLDGVPEVVLFVLSLVGAGVAGLGAVLILPATAILLYLSFGAVWLVVPLAAFATLIWMAERRIRAAR